MYKWHDAKVGGSLRRALLVANDISWHFDDEKIRSAYVLFAAMNDPNSLISKQFQDMGYPVYIIDIRSIIESKEVYAAIFGEEAAERFYSEEPEGDEEGPLNSKSLGMPDDEITNKVLNVLNGIFDVAQMETRVTEPMVPSYSDKLEMAFDDAFEKSLVMEKDFIDLDVALYCILNNKESSAYKFINMLLPNLDIDVDDFINSMKINANIPDENGKTANQVIVPKSLETCISVLNNQYKKGDKCSILGRDKEIFKAFTIFSKKTKRNAVLVGDPGVGKSAIVEAITQAIVNEICPKEFIGYTVLSLDVNAMVAGTKYRGEFETKVAILKDFLENTPKVILFVDEMHQMLGAGGTSEGHVDLSGSLKPVLSRDDVVFVGATTVKEYNQILSRDGAFKRRFEIIMVNEPKNGEVKAMIKAKLQDMQKYHSVKMPEKLVDYIILCSSCFNKENCNPDRTLDLCDRSMAIAKMGNKKAVSKADVNKVYEEFYDKYEKLDKRQTESTAYHEIGHYVVTRLTKENEATKVIAISIIPSNDFLGVNILEDRETFVSANSEYNESYIMSLLAGRVAQKKISNEITSGARSDLKMAKEYAKRIIAEFGMDKDEYKNMYLLDEDLFNEKLAVQIDEKANKMIKEIYEKTEKFIDEHWDLVDKMAKYLIKKKIVTSDELDKFMV